MKTFPQETVLIVYWLFWLFMLIRSWKNWHQESCGLAPKRRWRLRRSCTPRATLVTPAQRQICFPKTLTYELLLVIRRRTQIGEVRWRCFVSDGIGLVLAGRKIMRIWTVLKFFRSFCEILCNRNEELLEYMWKLSWKNAVLTPSICRL